MYHQWKVCWSMIVFHLSRFPVHILFIISFPVLAIFLKHLINTNVPLMHCSTHTPVLSGRCCDGFNQSQNTTASWFIPAAPWWRVAVLFPPPQSLTIPSCSLRCHQFVSAGSAPAAALHEKRTCHLSLANPVTTVANISKAFNARSDANLELYSTLIHVRWCLEAAVGVC